MVVRSRGPLLARLAEPGVDAPLLYTLPRLLCRPSELRGVDVGESCCRLRCRSCTPGKVGAGGGGRGVQGVGN